MPDHVRPKRTPPVWLRGCYAMFIALPLTVMGAGLFDADAVLDAMPPGLLYIAVALWLIATAVVAADRILIAADARAARKPPR